MTHGPPFHRDNAGAKLIQPGLVQGWTYRPGRSISALSARRLIRRYLTRKRPSAHHVLRWPSRQPRWVLYFVFCPNGSIDSAHQYTLRALQDSGLAILVVVACPTPKAIDLRIVEMANALIWKGLSGYDFSAHSIGLRALAQHSPGADVLVLNDSVLGPFADLNQSLRRADWQLTGFTASSLHEDHIQSYAFIFRDFSNSTLTYLASAFPADYAFYDFGDVILCPELYLARLAARRISVGAFWYGSMPYNPDPTLKSPSVLLDHGFPFLKRSLFGKHSDRFGRAQPECLSDRLRKLGHPPFP